MSGKNVSAAQDRLIWKPGQVKIVKKAGGKQVKSFVSLRVQALKGLDVLSLVPPNVLRDLPPHPFLQAYSICHEGLSRPTVLGEGSRIIRWTRAAVQSLKKVVLRGVKFFMGHNADNSTEGRKDVGEVIWDEQREIGGVLHHIVVGYFPDRKAVEDADICSQEGEWNFLEEASGWIADKVEKLTGIALSNSKREQPAFPDARRLGMVQAFEGDDGAPTHPTNKGRRRVRSMGDAVDLTTVRFSELVEEVKRRNTYPHQLFTLDDLRGDREFGRLFTESEQLTKKVKDQDEQIKKLADEKKASEQAAMKASARQRYDAMLGEVKLTPKQKVFLQKSFPDKAEDLSDVALKAHIDGRLRDYKTLMQTLNIKEDAPAATHEDETELESAEEGSAEFKDEGEADLSKAKNNPLLEEDLQQ